MFLSDTGSKNQLMDLCLRRLRPEMIFWHCIFRMGVIMEAAPPTGAAALDDAGGGSTAAAAFLTFLVVVFLVPVFLLVFPVAVVLVVPTLGVVVLSFTVLVVVVDFFVGGAEGAVTPLGSSFPRGPVSRICCAFGGLSDLEALLDLATSSWDGTGGVEAGRGGAAVSLLIFLDKEIFNFNFGCVGFALTGFALSLDLAPPVFSLRETLGLGGGAAAGAP